MNKKSNILLAGIWALLLIILFYCFALLFFSGGNDMQKRYARLETIRSEIVENYYQEVDEDLLMEGAIWGMTSVLEDPYTFYYTPEEMQEHHNRTNGEYHGFGMLLQRNSEGLIEVIRVFENSPADQAGVCIGDRILAVDGQDVYIYGEQAMNEIVSRIQGENATQATFTMRRGEEIIDIVLVRADVHISNVASCMLDDNIGYIAIVQFDGDALEAFRSALQRLHDLGMQGLVIDLRNNPGGLLDDAVAIADLILPEGSVVYTQDRAGNRVDYVSDENFDDVPLVVLINGMSASASEILAASVQDFERGNVIGTRSYGKGIVQTLVRFAEDGAGFQYTSETYFTPKGNCIHGYGVTPDVVVETEDGIAYKGTIPDPENDKQLQIAIEELKKEFSE